MASKLLSTSLLHYKTALVRDISENLIHDALRTDKTKIVDFFVAKRQHDAMVDALKRLGLKVHILPSDNYPDSVFIEDTAVIIGKTALITRQDSLIQLTKK